MYNRLKLALAIGVSLLGFGACQRGGHDSSKSSGQQQLTQEQAASSKELKPYSFATWRLARAQLNRVVLRVSHIAIRHRDSNEAESPLRMITWLPDAKVTRTRDEAIRIAQRISASLRKRPGDFGDLAQRLSDDPVTAPWGGSLGVISAARLPDEFLDAIAVLKPGEISRPFETAYGIHVLRLDATGPEQTLAASRVVVAYDKGSPAILRPGRVRERTRAEALRLARQIAEEARAPGASFEQLVDRYTDSPDVAQAGDLGVWSTYDAASTATRNLPLEALSRVPVGAITDPVDSPDGIQVLKRVEAGPRERFAAAYLEMRDLNKGDLAPLIAKMKEIRKELRQHPERFESYHETICCKEPWTWTRGRGLGAEVEAELSRLEDGEIAPAPIVTATGVFIVKRIAVPSEEPAVAWLDRLPSPSQPDFDEVLRHVSTPGLAYNLKLLQQSLSTLQLPLEKRKRVELALADTSAQLLQARSDERPSVFAGFWGSAAGALSPQELQQLRMYISEFAKYQLMSN